MNDANNSRSILHNALIVTMVDKESRVFRNGGIVIDNDRIVAIGQSADIIRQYSSNSHEIIDLHGQFLLPVDEMYLASLINKGSGIYTKGTSDPTALPAESVLKMAIVNGAKAVPWENEIGSLEVGKKADMIVINPSSWSMVPIHDWYRHHLHPNNPWPF